jgi:hypothetical protein
MTMLDDDTLTALLTRAGESFAVPENGAHDVLARARSDGRDEPESPDPLGTWDVDGDAEAERDAGRRGAGGRAAPVARVLDGARRHRVLSVAACVVLALAAAATVVGVLAGSSPARRTTAAERAPSTSHAPSPATSTVPSSAGLAFGGRSQGRAASPSAALPKTPTTTPTTAPPLPSGAVGQNAKIEQSGSLSLSVGQGDLGAAVARLEAIAVAQGGYVATSQSQSGSGSGGPASGSVTLQVPVDNFQTALTQAEKLGRATDVSTKATDVTGQYVDLQSRIAALEASRQQYLTIMTKATSVGDVLAVQSQLDSIQSQIEQLQGQLQVLSGETSYSTLAVTVSEGTPPARPGPVPESGLVHAWHESIGGFVSGVDGLIGVAGPLLFAVLCAAVVIVGGRALWRRARRHSL